MIHDTPRSASLCGEGELREGHGEQELHHIQAQVQGESFDTHPYIRNVSSFETLSMNAICSLSTRSENMAVFKGQIEFLDRREQNAPAGIKTTTKRKADFAQMTAPERFQKKRKLLGQAYDDGSNRPLKGSHTTHIFRSLPTTKKLSTTQKAVKPSKELLSHTQTRILGRLSKTSNSKVRHFTVSKYLRKNKPVATQIPIDVWQNILSFCPPAFLLEARFVSRDFNTALRYSSTWKQARLNTYGSDQPDPPSGLTEIQYADLLAGVGCQSKSCNDEKARKIYWAYSRRWCDKCLKQKTQKSDLIATFVVDTPRLLQCIQPAVFDYWGNYMFTGTLRERPDWSKGLANRTGYERSAIAHAIQEIDTFLKANPDTDEQNAWFAVKSATRDKNMKELQNIEQWVELWRQKKSDSNKGFKETRAAYYKQKALTMEPPLELAAIIQMRPYLRAISIPKPPSEKSWLSLKKKLYEERDEAEKLEVIKKEEPEVVEQWLRKKREYVKLSERRMYNSLPEQSFVLALADKVIKKFGLGSGRPSIADRDIVHVILRGVYTEVHQLSESELPKDKDRPYRLLMDDARLVYQKKIEPIFSGWRDYPRGRAAAELKCPGCNRCGSKTVWIFEELFKHIYERHVQPVGAPSKDFSVWRINPKELPPLTVFPWCRIEWPLNLPMLGTHQKRNGRWDPKDDSGYQVSSNNRVLYHDAFRSRCASSRLGPPPEKFVENILYAADRLRGLSLPAHFRTQIAFHFALHKWRFSADVNAGHSPAFSVLDTLQLALVRRNHDDLFENFRCLACCQQAGVGHNNKFASKDQAFGELIHHYQYTRIASWHSEKDWATKLLRFPRSEDLSAALYQSENMEAFIVFTELFQWIPVGNLDPSLQRELLLISSGSI